MTAEDWRGETLVVNDLVLANGQIWNVDDVSTPGQSNLRNILGGVRTERNERLHRLNDPFLIVDTTAITV